MATDSIVPGLGQLVRDPKQMRDAVHVAVAVVTAAKSLMPGARIGFLHPDSTELVTDETAERIGIVDPFLEYPVVAGERFWMCLFPGTIDSLRHVWTHSAFTARQALAFERARLRAATK